MENKYFRGNKIQITEKGDNIMIIPSEPSRSYLPGFKDREFSYAFSRPQSRETVRKAYESMGDELDVSTSELLNGFMNEINGVKSPIIAIRSVPQKSLELDVIGLASGGSQ